MKPLQILTILLLLTSCAHRNSKEETRKFSDQLKEDIFVYRGNYEWAFNLMGGEQVSTHTFFPDSIRYTMAGKVYSTTYTMKKLSYEKEKEKWIGEDESGIVYVLFFKEKTDNTLTLYKHKCKATGLEEALSLGIPAPAATTDHGWNVYALNGKDIKDVLSIFGHFSHAEDIISVSDSIFEIDEKKVRKMSFHTGERRWVGQYQDQYLQVFFKNLEGEDFIELSTTWSNDLEALYNTKYNSITDWKVYKK